eukprot:2111949-Pyramimonas_sp.AAC.1
MVLTLAGASTACPVQAAALRALVEAIIVKLPTFTDVDRRHLHSDGAFRRLGVAVTTSWLCLWSSSSCGAFGSSTKSWRRSAGPLVWPPGCRAK